MKEKVLDVTLKRAICIWWAFVWRVALFSFVITLVIGVIVGVIFAIAQKPDLARIVAMLVGNLISIPISIAVFKHILTKEYKNFSIVLVTNEVIEVDSNRTVPMPDGQ